MVQVHLQTAQNKQNHNFEYCKGNKEPFKANNVTYGFKIGLNRKLHLSKKQLDEIVPAANARFMEILAIASWQQQKANFTGEP